MATDEDRTVADIETDDDAREQEAGGGTQARERAWVPHGHGVARHRGDSPDD